MASWLCDLSQYALLWRHGADESCAEILYEGRTSTPELCTFVAGEDTYLVPKSVGLRKLGVFSGCDMRFEGSEYLGLSHRASRLFVWTTGVGTLDVVGTQVHSFDSGFKNSNPRPNPGHGLHAERLSKNRTEGLLV